MEVGFLDVPVAAAAATDEEYLSEVEVDLFLLAYFSSSFFLWVKGRIPHQKNWRDCSSVTAVYNTHVFNVATCAKHKIVYYY